MKRANLLFPALMLVLTILTASRYARITHFRNSSSQFSVEIDADDSEANRIKDELRDMTFQPVEESQLDGRRRRLTFRCPPEKLPFILKEIGEE